MNQDTDPATEPECQKQDVKNTVPFKEAKQENYLATSNAPGHTSLDGDTKANDEPRSNRRPYYSSAGYHEYTLVDGVEVVNFYPWDHRPGPGRYASSSSKSNSFSSVNPNGTSAGYNFSSDSCMRPYREPSGFDKSILHSQHGRHSYKDFHQAMNSSSPSGHHRYAGAYNKPRSNSHGFNPPQSHRGNEDDLDASKEIVCGPRARSRGDHVKTNETKEDEDLPYFAQRRHFNKPDFQTEYENAKFYIIKSFGEDNVHKSVKYGAWSSTPNGNDKLDAAYIEAKAKAAETGKPCPVYFFFSVNRSGQFVGVAEMVGSLDSNQNLDFWQLDKWSGWFPVKWRIVKDVSHSALRHIILKENDNKPVTYTRDTQEIGLAQGIEMLEIFKNHTAKTSLLDDFPFYENREKLLAAERKSRAEESRRRAEKHERNRYHVSQTA
uniref:YTH domain-containing family protein n=1 Tax=Kalanchoe fedtschenkoi TaxID=63787 RepID=A0A7N0TXT3_KALFE